MSDNPVPAIEPAFEPEQVQRAESGFNYNDLPPDDANKVRAAAQNIRNHLKRSVIDIGRELVTIKPVVGHGKFTDWVRMEFRMENRTAQRYMAVATSFGDDCDRVSYLPPSVLFDLSGKKPHHIEARFRLLAQIAKGGRPGCQTALNIDPGSASNFDPPDGYGGTPLISPAKRVGVAQPG